MSGWGGGYITDITYTIGWYRQQSPVMMAMASLIGGAAASIPAGDDNVTLLELGCGFGYGAMALAASNPSWTIAAVDFNPAHIASAREWANEAGLKNIAFIEADFARWEDNPALRDLPEMDFVTAHGIWSWIPPQAQAGIVRLLARKVRPGGLVHISYNTLPGWVDKLGVARLIREAGNRAGGRSDHRAREGMRLARELLETKAHFLAGLPGVATLLETLDGAAPQYLAHEFMNENWAPCFFTDVAAALAEAKLEWVASSNLANNFPELILTDAQREIVRRYSDPSMKELIRDMCSPQPLRHDVFVRGARRIGPAERAEALMDVSLMLVRRPEDLPEFLSMPAGRADLSREFYQPIVQALSTRPSRVRDLLKLPDVVGRRDNPAELISILMAAEMVEPVLRPMTLPGAEATRFNSVSVRRLKNREPTNQPVAAASRPAGIPIPTPLLALTLVEYMNAGITGLDGLVRRLDHGDNTEEAVRNAVATCLDRFIPTLKHAGVF
jgi:SAM-dependent methyltransferase